MSIRARVGLGIAVIALMVVGGSAIALYQHLDRSMIAAVDASLRSRADDLLNVVEAEPASELVLQQRRLAESDESYVVVRDERGATLAASGRPDASIDELTVPANLPDDGDMRTRRVGDDSIRLIELPAKTADGVPVTLAVGEALDQHDDALAALRTALLVGAPIVVLLLIAGALVQLQRPLHAVERVRRQAADYEADGSRERIELPSGDDEITRLARTVNDMLDRIDLAVERQRRFVASASHELRTPLAILKAELEAAASLPADQVHSALSALDGEVDRLALLADGLLVVAEQERDTLHAELASHDLCAIAEAVADRYRDRAARTGRTISVVQAGTDRHEVRVDRILFEQALANLVDNGLRHGEAQVTITVESDASESSVRVSDAGRGIEDTVANAGFAPFTRGVTTERGAGLGLSIVRAIMGAHGGEVRLETTSADDERRFVTLVLAR